MKGTDWRALERAVARMMGHCGWKDVAIIGRTGDKGGDILGIREESGRYRTWVVQVKAVTGGNYIGVGGLNEAMKAQGTYNAHVAVLATNGDFTHSVLKRQSEIKSASFEVKLWNGLFLKSLLDKWPSAHCQKKELRKYQKDIVEKAVGIYDSGGKRVHYVVATGLGKTTIAAEILSNLWEKGCKKALVLCHSQELALQLEEGFWPQIKKNIPTRFFFDGVAPYVYEGINFGLYQTLQGYLSGIEPGSFDCVIVDEAHHALAHGFRSCVDHLNPRFLIGMTATPWRGDGKSLDEMFGEPIARVSLVDGMAMGFLSQVDYRLYCDNIDWEAVHHLSKRNLSIRDLNKKLFVPQRDEAIIGEITKAVKSIKKPHIAIFCPSIQHAKRFALMLNSSGVQCACLSGEDRVTRRKRLVDFSTGRIEAVTAVDVLNEGIDVPDVNMLVFLRSTHSRRIFVQQLGRGLRIAPDKDKVIILDFVSDIRRLADVVDLDQEAKKKGLEVENLYLEKGIVSFKDERAQKFMEAWLADVAELGGSNDSEKLTFPELAI